MAQIIKHRRGSLEKLSEVTGSLQKGEIVIATGSANLTTTNGSALAFIVPESGSVQASNRFLMGSSDPAVFSASTYNGMVKGVPYYASGSKTLFLLGSDGNEAINLVGNIQPFSGSVNTRLGDLEASIGGAGSGVGARVTNLETISASYLAFTQSYYTDSASVATQFSASSASQTALSASIATTDSASAASQTALSSSIATSFSASAASVSSLSASIATTDSASAAAVAALSTSVDSRLDAVEFNGTTFATTGSNIFQGNQVITGSVYIAYDLIVQGSSSLQNITASAVDIGTNTVILNTDSPALRFGGVSVQDSGSGQGASGSLLWDSLNDRWIYEHPAGSSEGYNSAILIAGPKNTGSLGDEATLTPGYIQFATGEDHIGDSIMSQSNGDKITLTGGLDVTGNISSSTISGIGNVTLYSQSVDSRVATLETSLGGGGSIGTRVGNLETISASYLAFTQSYYTDSSSFDTRISASVAGYTANSASAATSFSASLASQTALSASIATTNNTQTDNITTAQNSADGAFASASAYSASLATSISASNASIVANSSSAATSFSASLATISANSASAATSFSASLFTITANSESAATSISASNAEIAALSSSVASVTGTFSSSVATSFSASAASVTALSASIATTDSASKAEYTSFSASAATDFNTLSGSAYTQFSASAATVAANSASVATSLSASLASSNGLSASIAITDNAQTDRIVKLEASQSAFDSAIELTGSNVTIQGDLLVRGTTTSVNSTTIELGDNIIELNGSGASNGGLYVKDVTSPNLATGSLIWDSTNDYWKAGVKDSESKVLLATGDGVVSGSVQIDITSTTGYSTFSSSIATTNSASVAYAASQLSSVSASVATSFSASLASQTALSSSVATSFSASAASVTALSSSVDSRLDTLEGTGTIQGVGTTNDVTFNSVTASVNIPGGSSTKRLAFRGLTDNIEFIAAPTQSGDIAQWNGTDFVMSNVIDGGSF